MLVHIGLKKKVDSSGRTCIPRDFLDELNVKSNQELEFNLVVLDGEKIITVKKVKSQPRNKVCFKAEEDKEGV